MENSSELGTIVERRDPSCKWSLERSGPSIPESWAITPVADRSAGRVVAMGTTAP